MGQIISLYFVNYAPNARGCPVILKGTLNKPWSWDAQDPDSTVSEVPDGYVYKSKEKVIDFDYWDTNGMASEDFVKICLEFRLGVRAVPVDVVQSSGSLTEKKYFYLLWSEWASVIDRDKSDYELDTDFATGDVVHHKYFPEVPVVLLVNHFVVDESSIPDSPAFKCLDLDYSLVCNEAFKQACEKARLAGLAFQDIESFRKDGFWG